VASDAGRATAPVRLDPAGTTILADTDYFNIFPRTWLAGSPTQSLGQPYSVVLTESRARAFFGDMPATGYINSEVIYEDSLHVRVSGIIKDYAGIRISATGRRFRIGQAIVWNLIDAAGTCHGQAATFARWTEV